jgi:hypothetical protein
MIPIFARNLFADQVRAQTGQAGLAGLVGGLAFNALLKRSTPAALVLDGALLLQGTLRKRRQDRAHEDQKAALQQGMAAGRSGAGAPAALTPRPATS